MYNQTSGTNFKCVPTILLKGDWLEECGFNKGDYIKVSCAEGKLVIEHDIERAKNEQEKMGQFISDYQLDKLTKSELRMLEKSLQKVQETS